MAITLPSDKIAERVDREYSTVEKSRKQLLWRLKRIRYPYGTTARIQKTFYVYVRASDLLDFLLSEPFLDKVYIAWYCRRYYELEKTVFDQKKSQYGYPWEFHRGHHAGALRSIGDESRALQESMECQWRNLRST